jgi:hypothetical protein
MFHFHKITIAAVVISLVLVAPFAASSASASAKPAKCSPSSCAVTAHLAAFGQSSGTVHDGPNTVLYAFTAHGHGIAGAKVTGNCTVQTSYQDRSYENTLYPVDVTVGATITVYGGSVAPDPSAVLTAITVACVTTG